MLLLIKNVFLLVPFKVHFFLDLKILVQKIHIIIWLVKISTYFYPPIVSEILSAKKVL